MNVKKRGRPAKKLKRNISGLRNQPRAPPEPPIQSSDGPVSRASGLDRQDDAIVPEVEEKVQVDQEEIEAAFAKSDTKDEFVVRKDKGPNEKPMKMTKKADEDEWLPPKQNNDNGRRRERPNEYIKGPDSMSKALRTQRRYKQAWVNQTRLDSFLVNLSGAGNGTTTRREVILNSGSSDEAEIAIGINHGTSSPARRHRHLVRRASKSPESLRQSEEYESSSSTVLC